MIQINFEKKDFYLFAAVAVFLVATGFVIAYGSGNPQLHGHDAGEIEGVGITWLASPIIVDTRDNVDVSWTEYANTNYANKVVLLKANCDEVIVYANPIGINNEEYANAVCWAVDNEVQDGVMSVWADSQGRFQYRVQRTDPPTSSFTLSIVAYN